MECVTVNTHAQQMVHFEVTGRQEDPVDLDRMICVIYKPLVSVLPVGVLVAQMDSKMSIS